MLHCPYPYDFQDRNQDNSLSNVLSLLLGQSHADRQDPFASHGTRSFVPKHNAINSMQQFLFPFTGSHNMLQVRLAHRSSCWSTCKCPESRGRLCTPSISPPVLLQQYHQNLYAFLPFFSITHYFCGLICNIQLSMGVECCPLVKSYFLFFQLSNIDIDINGGEKKPQQTTKKKTPTNTKKQVCSSTVNSMFG